MIQHDSVSAILQHKAEAWEREILDYIERYSDNMVARKILPIRNVGASIEIDVVTTYDRTGGGAAVCAKGVVPSPTGVRAKRTNHSIYQILDGFDIHEKDLNLDPKLKAREIDICMRNIHKAEDDLCLNGSTTLNVTGITSAVPSSNQISTSTNHGAWDSSEANDIHADFVAAINLIDSDFEPVFCAGNPTDINYLNTLDSERQPYWKTVIDLFPGAKSKSDFLFKSNRITAGTVYIGPKDVLAAELVVSENPKVVTLPLQRGRVYPVEVYEWVTPEIHNTDAFVSIATG